mgnify:CR=1 FL=1
MIILIILFYNCFLLTFLYLSVIHVVLYSKLSSHSTFLLHLSRSQERRKKMVICEEHYLYLLSCSSSSFFISDVWHKKTEFTRSSSVALTTNVTTVTLNIKTKEVRQNQNELPPQERNSVQNRFFFFSYLLFLSLLLFFLVDISIWF